MGAASERRPTRAFLLISFFLPPDEAKVHETRQAGGGHLRNRVEGELRPDDPVKAAGEGGKKRTLEGRC
jgi:hypothetical protein